MKKAFYFITIFLLVLSSCDPLAEIYDEMDAKDTGYSNKVEYTLTDADYSTIGTLATNTDAADAAFISSKKYFNDTVPAASYIPLLLAKKYPALSLGSSAMITYNYNGALPEELTKYTTAGTYTVRKSDYVSLDNVLQATKYFSPKYAPEVYIPEILADNVASPSAGDLMLVTYDYSTGDPLVDFANTTDVPFWQETFDAGTLGTFTEFNLLGSKVWVYSFYGPDKFAKISGYGQDNEDWLISGPIDLTDVPDASLNFRHTIKLFPGGTFDQISVLVSDNWDGTQAGVATATWNALNGYALPSGLDYTFVESGKFDFSSYKDKTINIAFKYTSNLVGAPTWEIDRVELLVPGVPVVGLPPSTYKTYYEFNGSIWVKAENLYYLNSEDYNAMGAPGSYDNFSSSVLPQDYLPALLKTMYPLAGQDFETILVYKYFTGTSTLTLADKYKFDNGVWVSSYNYVEPKTSQFLYSTTGWVFDPTVSFKMVSTDYQMIVDWVKVNKGASYIDSYGTQEWYTGAGSYYSNFDLHAGKWDATVFASKEKAVEAAIGVALLPTKFPAAVAQVSGIDVFYVISYATYDGSPNGNFTMKFQCTKSAPNPEFTLVEGPY